LLMTTVAHAAHAIKGLLVIDCSTDADGRGDHSRNETHELAGFQKIRDELGPFSSSGYSVRIANIVAHDKDSDAIKEDKSDEGAIANGLSLICGNVPVGGAAAIVPQMIGFRVVAAC